MFDEQIIVIKPVANGFVVQLPFGRTTIIPGMTDEQIRHQARVMKEEFFEDPMLKVQDAEPEKDVEEELQGQPNVHVFNTFKQCLDFLAYKYIKYIK
jgi:hypothetical protein